MKSLTAESQATECYPTQRTTDDPSFNAEQHGASWQATIKAITDIVSRLEEAKQ